MFEKYNVRIKCINSVQYISSHYAACHRYRFGDTRSAELIYKLGGEISVHFGDKTITEKSDYIRYLPARSKNADYYVDIISTGDCIDIYFDTDCDMPQEMLCEDLSKNKKIEGYFRKMERIWLQKNDGYEYECLALMYKILSELSQNRKYAPDKRFDKLSPVLDYIMMHCFEKNFSCADISGASTLSYSYIKRLFSEKYGMPPMKYVTLLRMRKAGELLLQGQYSVTEISALCGYENVYYFSRAFKEHYGMPPSEYR